MSDGITTVEDLLAKMRAGTKEVHEIRMREQIFVVRVISVDETLAVRAEAAKLAIARGWDESGKNVHIQRTTLKLASTIGQGAAPTMSDGLLSKLTLDELLYLYTDYIRVMEGVNPTLDTLPMERFRELVDALKKSLVMPRDLSLLELRVICSAFQELIQRPETPASPPAS